MSSRRTGTRASVIRAAIDLFAEVGFNSVGLESVGRAAGVSRQTVYDLFGSKSGLLRAMIEEQEREAGLPEMLQRMAAAPTGRAMLEAYLNAVVTVQPKVYQPSMIVYRARADDPLAAEMWNWRMQSRH